jgi:hypothetical protein
MLYFPTAVYVSARVRMYVINYEYLAFLLQEIWRDIGGIKWNVICMGWGCQNWEVEPGDQSALMIFSLPNNQTIKQKIW